MKRFSRDTWLAILLVVLLVVITIVAVIWQSQKASLPALSSNSNDRNGARALRLWLESMGYQVSNNSGPDYDPPADVNLILMLEPFTDSDENHWLLLDEWVKSGGVLVAAGDGWGVEQVFNHYDSSSLGFWQTSEVTVTVQTPLFVSPPLEDLSHLDLSSVFETQRDDQLILLAADGDPVLFTFRLGAGRVILASFIFPFTNAGLKEAGNPELVLNILSWAGQSRSVWFDEWHHGQAQTLGVVGPQDWLRFTSAGHAFLFVAVVVFLTFLLQGRGFGRPVPLPHQLARRTPLEYITALANLNRRAGHRSQVLNQYHHMLKQHLARRYRLNPLLPDAQYVAQLTSYFPGLDTASLESLLKRLSQRAVSESELVKLAAETAGWLKDNA
jgi:uncharacterized protein YneF (UPF0154 family)